MSSDAAPGPPTWATDDDLTAKARIRNAAFTLHASRGEANTTLREVARAAGVTHGLVVHHFGNRDGLRRAVQRHMLDLLRHAIDRASAEGGLAEGGVAEGGAAEGGAAEVGRARDASVARMFAEHPAYLAYLRRALVDPDQLDTELLGLFADFTLVQVRTLRAEGVATSDAPEQVQALAITLRELGPRLLEPMVRQLWTHLTGSDGPPPELEIRVRPAAGRPSGN
jgi:TetR/AcrR family transcriptional regulator, regulator of cefoperazone and chloramphenicol sensitivity